MICACIVIVLITYLIILTECLVVLIEYIQVIMSMEESVQHVVMMAIQEVSYFSISVCTVHYLI